MGWYSNEYWKSIYYTIFMFSILLFIFTFFTNGNTSFVLIEIANILLSIGILFELCLYGGNVNDLVKFFKYSMPFVLMILIIVYTLYILFSYQSIISNGYVSNGYYTFINISSILVLLQLFIFFKNKKEDTELRISPGVSGIICLIGILNMICMITVYIILSHYTTDGFMLNNR